MAALGYFPDFRFPSWFVAPDEFGRVIEDLWNRRYPELYEDEDSRPPGRLNEAFRALANLLGDAGIDPASRRCLFAAWALAKACEPSVQAWRPDDERPRIVQFAVERWLSGASEPRDWRSLFPQIVSPPQALHEALDVYWNLARMIGSNDPVPSLIEIFEDCFEGYAIFGGSQGRRDLFNWFLIEVMPAAWSLRLPDRIYTLHWPWPPQGQPWEAGTAG